MRAHSSRPADVSAPRGTCRIYMHYTYVYRVSMYVCEVSLYVYIVSLYVYIMSLYRHVVMINVYLVREGGEVGARARPLVPPR